MRITRIADIEAQDMNMEGAEAVNMRVLIGPEDGAPTFVMRLFEVEPGGHTPMHAHEWEHEIFVLDGEGEVVTPESRAPLQPRAAAFVAPHETHQFVNSGREPFRFLCLIPVQQQC
jgi:quercetin dioxygenase-like cupin family protein